MKKIFALASVFALVSTAALAQVASDFVTVDADASGEVSIAEANVLWPGLTAEVYAAADTDGDGKVSQTEYEAFLAANPLAQ